MATEVESIDIRMGQLEKFLDQYREKFQLNKISVQEVDIQTTVADINKMAPEDIGQKVMEWKLYAMAMQIRINDASCKLQWVEANLNKYLGIEQKKMSHNDGFTAKERQWLVLEYDEYAQKLYKLQTDLNIQIKQLEYLPTQVNFLAEVGLKICDNKWRERNGNFRN